MTGDATSVKFTVICADYFDGYGSVVRFSTVTQDGVVYRVQKAYGNDADVLVAAGIYMGGSAYMWDEQADRLRAVLRSRGTAP